MLDYIEYADFGELFLVKFNFVFVYDGNPFRLQGMGFFAACLKILFQFFHWIPKVFFEINHRVLFHPDSLIFEQFLHGGRRVKMDFPR